MPDVHLPRAVEIAFDIACGVLLAFAGFLLLMVFPAIATPVTNWALGIWGPDDASVGRAHLRFPAINEMVLEEFQAPGTAEAEQGEIRVNFFGFLPGLSWISRAEARRGYVEIRPHTSGGEDSGLSLTDWRRMIDRVALEDIEVRYLREDEVHPIQLHRATGSLRSGALTVTATGGRSELEFDGRASPADLSTLAGKLTLRGDNFADFAEIAGFAAPDTPPYDAVAYVTFSRDFISLDFTPQTRIGDSDLTGPLRISFDGGTPHLDADLRSAQLDFDDLGILFGIPVGVGDDETFGTAQASSREVYNASDRLIPNAVIDFSRLDAVDGTVAYTAETVTDAIFDIRGLKLEFEIEGRIVRAPLLRLDFDQGRLVSYVTLDGSQSPASTDARGDLTDVPFDSLSLDPYLRGTTNGEFEISTRGDGFRQAAANLDGRVSVWSKQAELLALAAEGAGLDLGEALTLMGEEDDDRTYTPARCAAVSVRFEDGMGHMDPAVIDTEDSLVLLDGQLNMKQETLDLKVRSEAKDASFGSLIGDVGIGGTFRSPEISALSGETVLQLGVSALLASVSGGLAALPFIEPGMAQDAPCGSVMARARSGQP